jgi:hypothetical protein
MLLATAAVAFVVVCGLGLRAVPDGAIELRPWPFAVLALVVVPLANVANALEFGVATRIGGQRVTGREALEVSVLSSAANLLPLPGAALVRVRAMRRGGSTYRRALWVTVLVGGAWLATSLVAAGGLLVVRGGSDVGVGPAGAVLATGLGLLAACAVATRSLSGRPDHARLTAALVAVELLAVGVAAARYLLVLHGLGLAAGIGQVVALTVAGVLASALGFVPGGLGLREGLAAVIAGLVGLPAATGVLAAAVDRLVGLPVLAVLALAIAVRGRAPARR